MRAEESKAAKAEALDDDELQQLIADRIDEDPAFWTGGGRRKAVIAVEVDDGHVTLKGIVRTAMDRRRADILARALGASTVDNRLRVAEEGPSGKSDSKRSVA
ncbi:MAG TPA: BON domain-containing protein [Vicinamibacterales bacterium]|jgi:osmotically-inducible protein OsmY|nr:BON domain-containing protein [Vicinamibacterales bacterium]